MNIEKLYEKYLDARVVSTDTRRIIPGSIFFSLKGPNFNANEFAQEALSRGASLAVVDEKKFARDDRYVLVDDSLKALQALARFHRLKIGIPVIGLTGSNGKTTSKELVHAVLSKKFKVWSTKGNLNNHIGVPLTVLSIQPEHEMAIVEMGANHLGEIAELSSIANPTHGFITNIGRAHIGTFGGFENILRGKSELFQHLLSHDGVAFINSKDQLLANMAKRFRNPVYYPAPGDYYQCELSGSDPFVKIVAENGEKIQTHLVGSYNFENIAVALCVGKFFGVDARMANTAVAEYTPENMRSQLVKKNTNTIILDAYNANPSSMEAAIRSLADMKGERKVAVLGDMYELEVEAEEEHRKIGTLLKQAGIAEAYLCGPLMAVAKSTFPGGNFYNSKDELARAWKRSPITAAIILIKGSRGMKMEELVEAL